MNCESREVPRSGGPKAESGEMHCCPRHEQALLSSSILNSRTRALDAHNPAQRFRCPDEENGLFPQKITSIGRRDDGSDLPRRFPRKLPSCNYARTCTSATFTSQGIIDGGQCPLRCWRDRCHKVPIPVKTAILRDLRPQVNTSPRRPMTTRE